jgi:internalin A
MSCTKSKGVVALLMLVAALFGCQCGAGNKGPGGANNNPGGAGAAEVAGEPAEKAAIEAIKKHDGSVKQEGGRVVEVHLFQNSVNDATLKELVPLAKIRKLRVSQAKLTAAGIKHLGGMTDLVELQLWNSGIDDAALKELAAMKQLKVLDLSGMKATGASLQALAPLTQLEELRLSSTQSMGDAAGINIGAQFKRLKKLDIDNSDLKDAGLAAIAELPDLRYLSVHGNFHLTAKGFTTLPRAKKLDELIIGFTFRDDSAKAVGACTNLRILRLFHCEITDKGFKELANLNQLQELEIRRGSITNVSNAVVDDFKKAHPNCKVKGP